MEPYIIALCIFIVSYALILSEKFDRTIIAVLGACFMVIFGVFGNHEAMKEAIHFIDFGTLGLLIGTMMVVNVASNSGLFQYLAISVAKIAKGNPRKIFVGFMLLTVLLSTFLANVTTVLLITPIIFVFASRLKISPYPFLFTAIVAANLGGTATLIGDPPNILIGSSTGLDFMQFLNNLFPAVIVISVIVIALLLWWYKKDLVASEADMHALISIDPKESITDWKLLKQSVVIIFIMIICFIFGSQFHLDPAITSLTAAIVLMALSRSVSEKVLKEVEWSLIFFFVGLFVLVGALEHTGVIESIGSQLNALTGGNLQVTAIVILWSSAVLSAIMDNIPFVLTMIPIIKGMASVIPDLNPLWWALAIGVNFGGNGTLIGNSANLVVAGLAEKNEYPISFMRYLKFGFVMMFITVALGNIYIWLRYLL